MSGWIPRILWPSDVRAMQAALSGYSTNIGNAVELCAKTGSSSKDWQLLQADWTSLQADITTYLAIEPSVWRNAAADYEAGEGLQKRLDSMSARVSDLGCSTPPSVSPKETPDWLIAVEWTVAGVGILGGAYLLSRVVPAVISAIPRPGITFGAAHAEA